MAILLIAISALVIFCFVKLLHRITKLEPAVLYLLIGLLLGVILKKSGYESITEVLPDIVKYNSAVLLFMFFMAGFSVNMSRLKYSSKTTARLFSVPAYTEAVLSGAVIFVLLKYIPGMELSFAEAVLVSSVFAVSSAADIVPVCTDMIKRGNKGKHNIAGTMITVSVADGFMMVPLVFISAMFIIAENTGRNYGLLQICVLALLTMAVIVLALFLGFVLGRVGLLAGMAVFRRLSRRRRCHMADMILIFSGIAISFILAVILCSFNCLTEVISTFGILVMCGMGIAIKNYDCSGAGELAGRKGSAIFNMFGMPVIFIYAGAMADKDMLTDPVTILMLIGITIASVVIKGTVSTVILKKADYSSQEISFVRKCFVPKGMSLICFSVLFSTISACNMKLRSFMIMLAAVAIISTLTTGVPMLKKAGENMK